MKKKVTLLALALAIVLLAGLAILPQDAKAATVVKSGSCGTNVTWTLDDEGTLTLSGTGAMRNYSYSSDVPWYYIRNSITNVVVCEGVTGISANSFRYTTTLKAVSIPSSLQTVGSDAFNGCNYLWHVMYAGDETDWNAIQFSSGNGSVQNATRHCNYSDTQVLDIANRQCCICRGICADETADGFCDICGTEVGFASGFCGVNLRWKVDEEGTLTIFGSGKMESTPWRDLGSSIKRVVIQEGVTSIARYAFSNYTDLTNITIPDSVTSIDEGAFYYCAGLTSIVIPNNVTSIGEDAFTGCSGLTSFTIPSGVTTIGGYTFSDCSNLSQISIPDGVTDIGAGAFSDCISLKSITIPGAVQTIGMNAFRSCTGLESVTIENGVAVIEGSAFQGCTGLTGLTIPDSVTQIGHYAFKDCTGLVNVHMGDGVTELKDNAFQNCTGLAGITLSKSLAYIDSLVFENCSSLLSITIPDGVSYISSYAFDGCSGLMSVVIPDSVTQISSNAFRLCTSLTDVYYTGTEDEWNWMSISEYGNSWLTDANIHFGDTTIPQDEQTKFLSTGLSLGTFIGLQNLIAPTSMNNGDYSEAYFIYNQYTTDSNGELVLVDTVQGAYMPYAGYLVADISVSAKQMSDVYEIIPYYVLEGKTVQGVTTTTSVKAEAMKKIIEPKTDDKTRALCIAMLNYGATAQANFSYSTGNYANSQLESDQRVLPSFDSLRLSKVNCIPSVPFAPASTGMSLGDVVYMQFLVKMADVSMAAELRYFMADETVSVPLEDLEIYRGSYYLINIPIKAKNVRTGLNISFCDQEGNYLYAMACSIEGFAKEKKGTSTETLVAALMAYGDAAKAVFG